MMTVIIITVFARTVGRIVIVHQFGWDDYTMIAAVVFYTPFTPSHI